MSDKVHFNVPLRSALGRVRGQGSAHTGTHHWVMQRVTSVALLPLTVWFALSAAGLADSTHAEVVAWIARPFNTVLLIATILLSFHHTLAGLQVILEDYLRQEWWRLWAILAAKGIFWLAAIAAIFSILRIAV